MLNDGKSFLNFIVGLKYVKNLKARGISFGCLLFVIAKGSALITGSFLCTVPSDYFAHVDANGRRVDLDQRPELVKGSVEFIAPSEYMVRPPMPPMYFFLIDVSISAVQSGMLEVICYSD